MGQVTIAIKRRAVVGNRRETSFDLTFSASYATSGDTIAAADLQALLPEYRAPTTFAVVEEFASELGPAGHAVFLDRTNAKFLAFNGTTQIANTTNLSAVVVRCIIRYGDGPSPVV